MKALHLLLASALALTAAVDAQAQWKWRDASGATHYSDQPPPVTVPQANILHGAPVQPAQAATPGDESRTPAPPALAGAMPQGAAKPGQTQRAGANGRTDAPNQAKGKAGENPTAPPAELTSAQLEQLAQACTQLREEVRTLESGMRLARVNARGEPEVISEEDRAKRVEYVKREIRANCPLS